MRLASVALFRVGRLFALAHRGFNHLAAGTLRIDDLRAGTKELWERDELRDEIVGSGLLDWEEDVVTRFMTPRDVVLLVGSGPGRDLLPLVERGYHVTGVEPARRAIATCRRHLEQRGLSADIIEGYFEEVTLSNPFDVIVFSFGCYSLMPDSRRRIAALRKAGAHLTDGGRIVVSYLAEYAGHPVWIRFARIAATLSGSDWRPERGDLLQSLDTKQPTFHYRHPFRPGEIDAEISAAGLRVVYRRDVPGNPVLVLMRA